MEDEDQTPTLTAPHGGSTPDTLLPSNSGQASLIWGLRSSLTKRRLAPGMWEGMQGWS